MSNFLCKREHEEEWALIATNDFGGNVANAIISKSLHNFDMVFGHFTSLPTKSTRQGQRVLVKGQHNILNSNCHNNNNKKNLQDIKLPILLKFHKNIS